MTVTIPAWVKVVASGVVSGATVAGTTLAQQCGGDTSCYKSHWMGALIVGILAAFGVGGAYAATSPFAVPTGDTGPAPKP